MRKRHPFFWLVLAYAVILAAIFVAVGFLIDYHGWPSRDVGWKFEFRNDSCVVTHVLIPTTVGYAILKHRMFDIQIVVRRGVHYLLARGFLQVLIYLPAALRIYTIRAIPAAASRTFFRVILFS